MAARNRSFVLWLHGLGDSGPANEPIRNFFTAPEFRLTKWAFPSAPNAPVSCNRTHPAIPRLSHHYNGIEFQLLLRGHLIST
jgi:predicted esterase